MANRPNGEVSMICLPHPESVEELHSFYETMDEQMHLNIWHCKPVHTYGIEKVHAMPGQGVTSMFTFGKWFGGSLAALGAMFDGVRLVSPREWQKHYGMKKEKGETSTSWKNRLKAKAQEIFPDNHITLKTADAVLIANYLYETL